MLSILIYGAGAVGLGLASCLIKAGEKVTLVGRDATVAALCAGGLLRRGLFGEFRAVAAAFKSFSALTGLPPQRYDYVLVTTKSFDSKAAAADLARQSALLDESTKIVLCQNGWGNAEIFREYFRSEQIYNARIITGFIRPAPNEVNITVHAEPARVGSLFGGDLEKILPLCRAITAGGLPCEPAENIAADLWAKLLYNCALNPLSAILDVPYGRLGEQENTCRIMDEIVREIFTVMAAAGHATHYPTAEDYLKIFYAKFLPLTAGHRSSMLQDIKAGKRTEIEALTGSVIALAERHGLRTPFNQCVYRMVKFREGFRDS